LLAVYLCLPNRRFEHERMTRIRVLRVATASLVTLVVVLGVASAIRYGALCSPDVFILSVTDPVVGPLIRSLGIWRIPITVTCPLGFVERSLAAGALLPQWPSVVLVVLSVIVFGRVFCAWICPVVPLRRVCGDKGGGKSRQEVTPRGTDWASYSSYAVLGSTLLASYLFRFPVFCFFCPIGLIFGFLYALVRVFSPDSVGLELVLFPAMLVAELWLLKSWCRAICPLGALLSIAGNLNRFLLPTIRKDRCLTTKSAHCRVCERACPEGIDLAKLGSTFSPSSCTKCLECYEKCPAKAIRIAILR
jgi:ferredoxin-type protein NapH